MFASGIIDPQEVKIVTIPWVKCSERLSLCLLRWLLYERGTSKGCRKLGKTGVGPIKTIIKTGCGTLCFSTGIINHT